MKYCLKYLQACLNASTEVAKEKYYHNTANKLTNTQKNSKVYWSLLKIFLNNKKKPTIPTTVLRKCFTTVSAKDIGETIKNLDSNKDHRHDNISIHMLKICGDSICVLSEMIFKQAVLPGVGKRKYYYHSQKEQQTKY